MQCTCCQREGTSPGQDGAAPGPESLSCLSGKGTDRKRKVAERVYCDKQLPQRGGKEATTESGYKSSINLLSYYASYMDIIHSCCVDTVILISSFGTEQLIRVRFSSAGFRHSKIRHWTWTVCSRSPWSQCKDITPRGNSVHLWTSISCRIDEWLLGGTYFSSFLKGYS